LKAVHHILASSAETIGAFNSGLYIVNLHRRAFEPGDHAVDAEGDRVVQLVAGRRAPGAYTRPLFSST
jgi:hypothetical protein